MKPATPAGLAGRQETPRMPTATAHSGPAQEPVSEHTERQMTCPACGENAEEKPSGDLVSWGAHGLTQPEWSHRDGSSLCPVIGPSGGYEPAQPVVAEPAEREAGQ